MVVFYFHFHQLWLCQFFIQSMQSLKYQHFIILFITFFSCTLKKRHIAVLQWHQPVVYTIWQKVYPTFNCINEREGRRLNFALAHMDGKFSQQSNIAQPSALDLRFERKVTIFFARRPGGRKRRVVARVELNAQRSAISGPTAL